MFKFKKHTNILTIRDLTNKLYNYLGCNSSVTFWYARVYPNTKVTELFISWLVTHDEVYTVRFDADYIDEILKDEDDSAAFAAALAKKFKKMQEIDSKIEKCSSMKETAEWQT